MKAEIITLQNIKNYGSMLQAYATQEIMKKVGFQTELIDYTRRDALFWNHILGYSKKDNIVIKILKTIILLPTEIRYALLWEDFKKKNLISSKMKYSSLKELRKNIPVADIYCSGSDQVWNSGWNGGVLEEFFLEFAPKGKKKYALASSIGLGKFTEDESVEIQKYLKKFELISVREESAKTILEELGISNVVNVLDPTLTVDGSFWEKFIKNTKKRKPYLLIYQLGKNNKLDKWANAIAKERQLEIVRICIRYDYIFRNGKPSLIPSFEEFLTLFKEADCILTDSFHASCFSLNFEKEFWCILPEEYQGRIKDMLKKFCLSGRIIDDSFKMDKINEKIDYSQIKKLINFEREKTWDYYKAVFRSSQEN